MSTEAQFNATCILIKPESEVGSNLQLSHSEKMLPRKRCSLSDLSVAASFGAMGKIALNGYTCRIPRNTDVKPGWRVKIQQDGETVWRAYSVQKVQLATHTRLIIEAM